MGGLQLVALDPFDIGPCIVRDFTAAPAKVPGCMGYGSANVLEPLSARRRGPILTFSMKPLGFGEVDNRDFVDAVAVLRRVDARRKIDAGT
jgi:hypothetical protein